MAEHGAQNNPNQVGHGNTPAAWTGTIIEIIATALICLGIVLAQPFLWVPGVILVPVGAVVWVAMKRAGYDTEGPRH